MKLFFIFELDAADVEVFLFSLVTYRVVGVRVAIAVISVCWRLLLELNLR